MKFAALAVAASSLAVVSTSPVQKREIGGILICTGVNATNDCIYKKYELKKCQQLEAPFRANTNTFAPDGDNFACYPRAMDCGGICTSPTGCTFGTIDFNYVHKFNLSAIGWSRIIRSFDCFETQDQR